MAQHVLYGDGIHDDQPAIQELIDSGVCEVCLPAPAKLTALCLQAWFLWTVLV